VLATFVAGHRGDPGFTGLVPLRVTGPLTTVEVGLVRRDGDTQSRSADELASWLRDLAQKPGG
jgi:hypothetical protein